MFTYVGIVINAISVCVLFGMVFYLLNELFVIKNRLITNQTQMHNLIKDINYNDTVLNGLLKDWQFVMLRYLHTMHNKVITVIGLKVVAVFLEITYRKVCTPMDNIYYFFISIFSSSSEACNSIRTIAHYIDCFVMTYICSSLYDFVISNAIRKHTHPHSLMITSS